MLDSVVLVNLTRSLVSSRRKARCNPIDKRRYQARWKDKVRLSSKKCNGNRREAQQVGRIKQELDLSQTSVTEMN